MLRSAILAAITALAACSASAQPGEQLLPRDLNKDGHVDAFYSPALNISWLANANAAVGSKYVATWAVGTSFDGVMAWDDAEAWVQQLDIYGVKGWRLPKTIPAHSTEFDEDFSNNGSTDVGYGNTRSELAHLYHVTLGNLSECKPNDANPTSCVKAENWGLKNPGPYSQFRSFSYWSDTEYAKDRSSAWFFSTDDGYQNYGAKGNAMYGFAIYDGDVILAVPELATWLQLVIGSVLIYSIAHTRQKRSRRLWASRIALT